MHNTQYFGEKRLFELRRRVSHRRVSLQQHRCHVLWFCRPNAMESDGHAIGCHATSSQSERQLSRYLWQNRLICERTMLQPYYLCCMQSCRERGTTRSSHHRSKQSSLFVCLVDDELTLFPDSRIRRINIVKCR